MLKFLRIVMCGLVAFMLIFTGIEIKENLRLNAQIISKIPTTHKVVALTFDDGPSNKTTPEILAILKEKKVRATFFVVGENAERFHDILGQEVKDGHEIGIHTYDHKSLRKLSKGKIEEELQRTEKAIADVTAKPTLFRPPGGAYSKTVLQVAQDMGYNVILWSVDPQDWQSPPVVKVVDDVVTHVKPGSIILLHDLKSPSPTPAAVRIIIDRLKEQGYELITVSELLQYYDIRPSNKFSWILGGL